MARKSARLFSIAREGIRRLDRAPVFSILSFALLILVIGLWLESSKVSGVFGVRDWAGRLQAVGSDRGGVILFFSDVPFGAEMRWTADAMRIPAEEFGQIHEWLTDKTLLKWHGLGFGFSRGTLKITSSMTCRFGAVMVPYWFLIGVLGVLPGLWVRRGLVQWRRGRRGACRACGYDLRGSPGGCPECGAGRKREELRESGGVRGAKIGSVILMLIVVVMVGWMVWRTGREPEAMGEVEQAAGLDRFMPEFVAEGIPLDQALDEVSRKTGTRIVGSSLITTRTGTGRFGIVGTRMGWKTPVWVRLRRVSVADALNILCQQASNQFVLPLTFGSCEDGSIFIGADDEMPSLVRVYHTEGFVKTFGLQADLGGLTAVQNDAADLQLLFDEQQIHGHRGDTPSFFVGGTMIAIAPHDWHVRSDRLCRELGAINRPWPEGTLPSFHTWRD